ncbi:MAG: tail fiber domain-containing protein [Alphaproteobacteria bacterium]|nr:tail fiber domain-containing protein [Alphaproteobacteria bacterium]
MTKIIMTLAFVFLASPAFAQSTTLFSNSTTGNVGIGTTAPVNPFDVYGQAAIGTGYAGVSTAPANGLLVQGKTGIGTSAATDALDIGGAVGIVTTSTAPNYGMYGATTTSLAFSTNGVKALEIGSSGAITTGLWNATPITVPYGGTGATTLTSNGVLYGNGTGIVQATAQGGANSILTANAGAPAWSAAPTIGTSVTTPLIVGGTSASSTLTLESTSGTGTSDAIVFKTGSQAERMRVTSAGKVGIGTASPGYQLVGYTSTPAAYDGFQMVDISTSGVGLIQAVNRGGSNVAIVIGTTGQTVRTEYGLTGNFADLSSYGVSDFAVGTVDNNPLIFGTNSAERMRISSAGNVGIGTTAPGTVLDIAASPPTVRLTNSSTTQYAGAAIDLIGPSSLGNQGGTYIAQQNNNSGATQGGFIIDQQSASGVFQGVVLFADYNAQTFALYTNNTPGLWIDSAQKVLVGYTASQSSCCRLQVNGTIGATSTSITSLSDRRLKEHIEPLTGALGVVNDLKPVTYNFLPNDKQQFPEGTQVGFIAQDVEAAVKDQPYAAALVDTPKKRDDYYTLREGNMIPLLVKAIQEQQAEIDALKRTIADKKNAKIN